MNPPTGSGRGLLDGIGRQIGLLILAFFLCAAFLALPAGAKLTGEHALRQELDFTKRELQIEREQRVRLQTQIDLLDEAVHSKLETLNALDRKVSVMAKDVEWLAAWLKAAGRR